MPPKLFSTRTPNLTRRATRRSTRISGGCGSVFLTYSRMICLNGPRRFGLMANGMRACVSRMVFDPNQYVNGASRRRSDRSYGLRLRRC